MSATMNGNLDKERKTTEHLLTCLDATRLSLSFLPSSRQRAQRDPQRPQRPHGVPPVLSFRTSSGIYRVPLPIAPTSPVLAASLGSY